MDKRLEFNQDATTWYSCEHGSCKIQFDQLILAVDTYGINFSMRLASQTRLCI